MEEKQKCSRSRGQRRVWGEFRFKNIRKLKDREGARDQREEGRPRDER